MVDPISPFDPLSPPELKNVIPANSGKTRLGRAADDVPKEMLAAIQACFVLPPFRYRLSNEEELANYCQEELANILYVVEGNPPPSAASPSAS